MRDARGRWHEVAELACESCGCPWQYALDDPGVFWEAGATVSDGCEDTACECHVAPLQGLPAHLLTGV
jgi:hypothetical protein